MIPAVLFLIPYKADHDAAAAGHGCAQRLTAGQNCLVPVHRRLPGNGRSSAKTGLFASGLDSQLLNDQIRQISADIPIVSSSPNLKNRRHNGLSFFIFKPLAGNHHHASLFIVKAFYILQEFLLMKGTLRQINQMGRIPRLLPGQGRRSCNPSCVASHGLHDAHMDGQGFDIRSHLCGGRGNEPGRASISRSMVCYGNVIVNGLGNSHHIDVLSPARLKDTAAGIHGSVSPVEEYIPYSILPEDSRHGIVVLLFKGIP